jgi:hypothetical protein
VLRRELGLEPSPYFAQWSTYITLNKMFAHCITRNTMGGMACSTLPKLFPLSGGHGFKPRRVYTILPTQMTNGWVPHGTMLLTKYMPCVNPQFDHLSYPVSTSAHQPAATCLYGPCHISLCHVSPLLIKVGCH